MESKQNSVWYMTNKLNCTRATESHTKKRKKTKTKHWSKINDLLHARITFREIFPMSKISESHVFVPILFWSRSQNDNLLSSSLNPYSWKQGSENFVENEIRLNHTWNMKIENIFTLTLCVILKSSSYWGSPIQLTKNNNNCLLYL